MSAPMHSWWPAVDEWVDAYPGAQAERGQMYEWICDAPDRAAVAVPHHTRGPKVYERRNGAWLDRAWGVMVAARDIAAAHQPDAVRALRPHAGEAWVGCIPCPYVQPEPQAAATPTRPSNSTQRRRSLTAASAMNDAAARHGLPAVGVGEGRDRVMTERMP